VEEADDGQNHYRFLTVRVPSGSDFREMHIGDGEAEEIAQSRFEEFSYVAGFDAIWSSAQDSVECSLRGAPWSWANVLRLYATRFPTDESDPEASRRLGSPPVKLATPWPEVSLAIGLASKEHVVLCGETIHGTRMASLIRPAGAYATLQIRGGGASTHERTQALLQGLASTVLFALERDFRIPVHLAPPSPDTRIVLEARRRLPAPLDRKYASEPLELYWYGKTAGSLHLLGYLAFYQVLEYFFPAFSRRHMMVQARTVLTRPGFRADDDHAVGDLIEAIKRPKSEQEQLEQTLYYGVSPSELRTFIAANASGQSYFTSVDARQIAPAEIDAKASDEVVCRQAAARIYRIRCRIVHAKSGRKTDLPLLPLSPEAHLLQADLELVEFCAETVLQRTTETLVK
jgi:hypothetical protein